MIGSFMNNLKSRLTSRRVNDESLNSTDAPKAKSLFNKIMHASYSVVSQKQDDAYCNENLFMMPRAYLNNYSESCQSPISLTAPEKSLDELDNIVDKFVRCINMENNVHFSLISF